MTIDAAGRGHQPAGVPGGGQFTGNNRPQGPSLTVHLGAQTGRDDTLVNSTIEDVLNLPNGVVPRLQHIAPEMPLTGAQAYMYATGRTNELWDTVAQWTTEQATENGTAFLRDFCQKRDINYDTDFTPEQKDRLLDAVWSKDPAHPLDELIANTPKQLLDPDYWKHSVPDPDETLQVATLEAELYNLPDGVVPPTPVDPGHQLNAQQIDLYNQGQWADLDDSVIEWGTELKVKHGKEFLRTFCKKRGADYDEDFNERQQARLLDAVWSKDTTDPLDSLIANTPPHLIKPVAGDQQLTASRSARPQPLLDE